MRNLFLRPEEAAGIIAGGAVAVVAGAEEALAKLPRGRWIGGTTAYFMTEEGALVDRERIFLTVFDEAAAAQSVVLPAEAVGGLMLGRFSHGFTYLLLPAFSPVHYRYAIEASGLPQLFDQPVMGWVSGTHLDEIAARGPKVFDGWSGTALEAEAVAMQVGLTEGTAAAIDTINLFAQGDGPTLTFPETGFEASACIVDGEADNIARWFERTGADLRLPLVADYAGILANVSVRDIDSRVGTARFYAPLIAGESYRLARPIEDYVSEFAHHADADASATAAREHSCNCILNYLYAGLEGRHTAGLVGPITFGEIAYMLLNQTLVRLRLDRVSVFSDALGMHMT